ncbi:MAG: hypothetical protein ACFFAI_00940 [Promethearchaeota archaeon]
MVDFKKDSWFYALIAAIIAMIGILIPWNFYDAGGGITFYNWLGGLIQYGSGGGYDKWVGFNGLSIWTLGLSIFSIALLLFYSINTWKGKQFKWDWLMYILTGISLFISPILTLTLEGNEEAFPLGAIFIIIAGAISIMAFAVDKFTGR